MQVKLFEVRDAGTFIPAIAIKLDPINEQERYLLARAGFGPTPANHRDYVLFAGLEGQGKFGHDAYEHGCRTMSVAHGYIIENWDRLDAGQVIDVEFINGIREKPKVSERLTNAYGE